MKRLSFVVPLMFTAALALSVPSLAQQAPAGSTGACKDGTYTSVDKKRGACSGHGGVKEWYGTTAKSAKGEANSAASESKSAKSEGKAAKATATASGAATAAAPAEHAQKTASVSRTPKGMRAEAAPGGGAGKVWVNTLVRQDQVWRVHVGSASQGEGRARGARQGLRLNRVRIAPRQDDPDARVSVAKGRRDTAA